MILYTESKILNVGPETSNQTKFVGVSLWTVRKIDPMLRNFVCDSWSKVVHF